MFNRILALFGLMTIQRAKNLTARMHEFYVVSVVDGIRRDFEKPEVPGFRDKTRQWWENEFDKILEHHSDDVNITTEPKFLDYV